MLADDDGHLERLTLLLITLCPLVSLVAVCISGLVICSSRGCPSATNKSTISETVIENSLDQPLVVDVSAGPSLEVQAPAASGYQQVSHICKTPLSVWRQTGAVGLILCSIGSFVGLQVGCYMFKDADEIVPRDESLGLLAVALSGLGAVIFYRSEVKTPAHKLLSRRSSRPTARSISMIIYWLLMLAAEVYRLERLITIYRRDWSYMNKTFCILQLIADGACAIICLWTLWYFLRVERALENMQAMLHGVYKSEALPYISPPTTKAPSPEPRTGVLSLLTFVWLQPVLRKGRKEKLDHNDLYDLKPDDAGSILYARYAILAKKLTEKNAKKSNRKVADQRKKKKNKAKTEQPSLYKLIWRYLHPTFMFATGIKVIYDSISLLDVLIVNLLVKYMASEDDWTVGLVLCGLLGLNAYSETFLINQYFQRMVTCGIRVRSCLATAVFQKSMRVDQSQLLSDESSEFTSGKIINLMSTDAQRVGDVMSYIQILWSAPYQIIICSVMLYRQLGVASLGGIAVMLLGIPISALITKRTRRLQKSMMELKDDRLKSTSELIQGIKAIKIYTWEIPFMKLINGVRAEELEALRKSQYANSLSRFMINAIPVAVALVSFTIFVCVQKRTLTPAIAFTSLALFESLRFPLFSLPFVIMASAEAIVTMKRLTTFMALPELKQGEEDEEGFLSSNMLDKGITCENLTIGFKQSRLTDDLSETSALHTLPEYSEHESAGSHSAASQPKRAILINDITLSLRPGEYIALVGRTGCGKTVLVNTILKELDTVVKGKFTLNGKVALCEQTAWIQSGTIRDNILFGQDFDEEWYSTVVAACALEKDFNILKDGDMTEIGERGVNLSGGQKQRVALARAVYFNADIYILDDILSAVDTHVSAHLYKHVIKGLLKRKAVILSTHRFECLAGANQIFMLRKGKSPLVFESLQQAESNQEFVNLSDSAAAAAAEVTETATERRSSGSPKRAGSTILGSPSSRSLEMSPSACFSQELVDAMVAQEDTALLQKEEESGAAQKTEAAPTAKLVDDEQMVEGSVSGAVYVSYIKAGGGWIAAIMLLVVLSASQGITLGANFWLSHWSDNADSLSATVGLTWYTVIQCASLIVLVLALIGLIIITQKAAKYYHGRMLTRIVHAKMSFFESTPIGRLTNKFSKDLYTIDDQLPMTLYQFLNMLINVIASIIAIAVVLPIMLAIIVPVMVLYGFIERLYVSVARQFKRLDSVSRSPLFTHFSECLDGARSIRAMKQRGFFLGLHLRYLDVNLSAAYIYMSSNRWLSVRLECIGNMIVLGVALFCVLTRSKISGGQAGLALSYAIKTTGYLNWLVRMSGDRESNIVAVERVLEYDDEDRCPQEDYVKRWRLENEDEDSKAGKSKDDGELPLQTLPIPGQVELRNVSLRYRPELPFALKNVSFTIKSGEKVGIVGRTGAGKSSLLVCLLRLVDISDGSIFVHNLNSNLMSVDQLRNQISIIPQESVIFSGSLRRNLDPFSKKTDDQLWDALSKACLQEFVEALPDKLDHKISENGGNISVGQKQLLCLARVLLKSAKVLLLDEATSAVDPQTDALIQKCLRTEFEGTTIITIAHRLKTVADYDRIIVMAQGSILEQGNPQKLLSDPSSEFSKMYHSA